MDPNRLRRLIPTITDSSVLSFSFFLLSDLHQVLREPTLQNLWRVLTSLQLTANSPFDYPAFLFLGIVLINFAALLITRVRPPPSRAMIISSIPIRPSQPSGQTALAEGMEILQGLKEGLEKRGVHGRISIRAIALSAPSEAITEDELDTLREAVSDVCPWAGSLKMGVHRSPLTDLLFMLLSRMGLHLGGIYHPLQGSMSFAHSLPPTIQAYVYIHETFHFLGFGEVEAEIGTIETCIRVGDLQGMPLKYLGLFLSLRAVVGYLRGIGFEADSLLREIGDSSRAVETRLLPFRTSRLEQAIYGALKHPSWIRP